ncbi:MAG TPA: cysteine-rich CWC family protein [Pseudolabrys sp.]
MTPATSPRRINCARCGMSFECGFSAQCWCAGEPYRLPMTKARFEDCLCPACLRKAAAALAASRREAEQGG